MEDLNTRRRLSSSFPTLRYSLLDSTPEKTANIWQIEDEGISVTKFEAFQLHFLSHVFIAVAVIVGRGEC